MNNTLQDCLHESHFLTSLTRFSALEIDTMFDKKKLTDNDMFSLLLNKLEKVETKIDVLTKSYVSREDLEKLRTELVGGFLPRDVYDAKHNILVQKSENLEQSVREMNLYVKENIEVHKTDVKDIYKKISDVEKDFERKIELERNNDLSEKDRNWIRTTQIFGGIGIAISLLSLIVFYLQLVK